MKFNELEKLMAAGAVDIRENSRPRTKKPAVVPNEQVANDEAVAKPVLFTLTISEEKLGLHGAYEAAMRLSNEFYDYDHGRRMFEMNDIRGGSKYIVSVATDCSEGIEMLRTMATQCAQQKAGYSK